MSPPLIFAVTNTMSQQFFCFTDEPLICEMLSLNVIPGCFPLQKLALSPQQTQGGSVSSPHPSQPSQEESSPCSDMSSYEEPPSPLSAASSGPLAPAPAPAQVPVHRQPSRASDQEGCAGRDAPSLCQRFLPNDPAKWNVEEVYEFIRSLPGQWSKRTQAVQTTHTYILPDLKQQVFQLCFAH